MPVTITEVRSTERFVGTPEQARQVLHVTIERSMRDGEIRLEVTGTEPRGSVFASDVRGALTVPAGDRAVRVDVPLDLPERAGLGDEIAVRVSASSDGADEADAYGTVVVAEPGWTMVMVSHFHYDPVWWNTQASYTTDWDFVGPDWSTRPAFVRQRVRPRRGPPQARRSRSGLPLRPGRARLPQALLRHLPGAASSAAAAARRGPGRARRRDLQRAEHQPHQQRDDDPELRLRHRLPARHPRRRPADRLAAGRVRPRPPVPRTRRQGRAHRERVGARAVTTSGDRSASTGTRTAPATSPSCSSRASSSGSRRAATAS